MPQDLVLEEGRTENIKVMISHADLAILITVVEIGNCSLVCLTRGTVTDIMPSHSSRPKMGRTYEQPTEIEGVTST